MKFSTRDTLLACSLTLSAIMAVFLLVEAVGAPTKVSFDQIDVKRINLREDDGTLRMIISNTDRFPGIIFRGKEHPHPTGRKTAGMLFFNEEGTENGGLIFSGKKVNGRVTSGGHLSFDQYEQDQVVALNQREDNGVRRAGLTISDRPDEPLDFELDNRLMAMSEAERAAEVERLRVAGKFGRPRLFVGKRDLASRVELQDAEGRVRLALKVEADGAASIEFFDEVGKLVRTIHPGSE